MTFASEWDLIHQIQVWSNRPIEHFLKFYTKYYENKPEAVFLDLGCGTGASTGALAARGHTVYAVDGSETAIRRMMATAQQTPWILPNILTWVQDFCTIEMPPQSVDCIIDVCS